MSDQPAHLAERIAERLRSVGGLTAPEPAPERDIRRLVRRELDRKPIPRRPLRDAADGTLTDDGPVDGPLPEALDDRQDDDPDSGNLPFDPDARRPRAVVGTGRTPPVVPDQATALAVPEPPRVAPLDMAAMEKAGLVVGHKVRTRISEEFRIAVGHILRSMHANYSPGRGAPNAIMVTSARPGEGKSFSTLNLAGSIAQHAQREVILVDVDAKQRSLSAELGLAERPGLLDLSTNTSLRIEDVVIRTMIPHLSVVTIGSGQSVGGGHLADPADHGADRADRPALPERGGDAGRRRPACPPQTPARWRPSSARS